MRSLSAVISRWVRIVDCFRYFERSAVAFDIRRWRQEVVRRAKRLISIHLDPVVDCIECRFMIGQLNDKFCLPFQCRQQIFRWNFSILWRRLRQQYHIESWILSKFSEWRKITAWLRDDRRDYVKAWPQGWWSSWKMRVGEPVERLPAWLTHISITKSRSPNRPSVIFCIFRFTTAFDKEPPDDYLTAVLGHPISPSFS